MLVLASCQKNERPFVVSKIQAAAKLATCETTIDKIVLATEQKRVIKWLGGKKQAVFLAYSQATVKTGIDLNKLKPEDITIGPKTITTPKLIPTGTVRRLPNSSITCSGVAVVATS